MAQTTYIRQCCIISPLGFMREIVFIADRKEGLEPVFSEGPVRTLFRWLSFVQMQGGHCLPVRMSNQPDIILFLQRPLQEVPSLLDHLRETQDHNWTWELPYRFFLWHKQKQISNSWQTATGDRGGRRAQRSGTENALTRLEQGP